uniref:Putative transposase n=1 Tax=Candidatus Kentrum sp. FM TaxID=2126340 RepID=A0A450WIB0_9GAMM|nr:MAG: putative transposase [Candidatus Kentron sp. FM]VFJ77193.1 MAG: putative transposase [Candidatus Kentron sp. FM]VFK16767.1 MAG: putative transposase [Candidatus Kentron sp. FM]
MRYRRILFKGAAYFFTVNLVERVSDLRGVVGKVRHRHPFEIITWVVLPDHLHTIWRMPDEDTDYPARWALIKAGFSRKIPKTNGPREERIGRSREKKGERGIRQRRYWEHMIRDDRHLERHVNDIHYNPVKHGHAIRAADWEFSRSLSDLGDRSEKARNRDHFFAN